VLLVAAAQDMIGSMLRAVTKAGLTPTMVDLTPFAVLRALAAVDHLGVGAEAEAIVDIGSSVTNIVVHQGGVPRFVRILLMGGADVTEAVAERMGVSFEQAESVKQSMGLANSADGHPASRIIETTASAFIDEVRGSLDYYMAQAGAARLGRVVVTGGGSRMEGLAARISSATRIPVEFGTPMSRMRIGKTGLSAQQLGYVEPLVAVPVGLAMGMTS
jgi:type IV pilus assembly protein PilM